MTTKARKKACCVHKSCTRWFHTQVFGGRVHTHTHTPTCRLIPWANNPRKLWTQPSKLYSTHPFRWPWDHQTRKALVPRSLLWCWMTCMHHRLPSPNAPCALFRGQHEHRLPIVTVPRRRGSLNRHKQRVTRFPPMRAPPFCLWIPRWALRRNSRTHIWMNKRAHVLGPSWPWRKAHQKMAGKWGNIRSNDGKLVLAQFKAACRLGAHFAVIQEEHGILFISFCFAWQIWQSDAIEKLRSCVLGPLAEKVPSENACEEHAHAC